MVWSSVAALDPDPKDLHHFSGSGSIIFSMDPDLILYYITYITKTFILPIFTLTKQDKVLEQIVF